MTAQKETQDEFCWPIEDVQKLIKAMMPRIPADDSWNYVKRIKKLPWEEIVDEMGKYDADECQEICAAVFKRIRCFRLLREILGDALEWTDTPWTNYNKPKKVPHPDLPKKPRSPYIIFCQEHSYLRKRYPNLGECSKKHSELYEKLSQEEKHKYKEKYELAKLEYQRKMEIFINKHPQFSNFVNANGNAETKKNKKLKRTNKTVTPFDLYVKDRLKTDSKVHSKPSAEMIPIIEKEWNELPDSEKFTWQEKIEKINNKPKRGATAYSYYLKKELLSEELKHMTPKERFARVIATYKSLSKSQLEELKEEFKNHVKQISVENVSSETENKTNSEGGLITKNRPKVEESIIKIESDDDKHSEGEISKKTTNNSVKMKKRKNEDTLDSTDISKMEDSLRKKQKLAHTSDELDVSHPKDSLRKTKKKTRRNTETTEIVNDTILYPGEPALPPNTPFDLYISMKNKKNKYTPERMLDKWNNLEKSDKKIYKALLKQQKKEYAELYENFLNSLSEKKLKKYFVARELTIC